MNESKLTFKEFLMSEEGRHPVPKFRVGMKVMVPASAHDAYGEAGVILAVKNNKATVEFKNYTKDVDVRLLREPVKEALAEKTWFKNRKDWQAAVDAEEVDDDGRDWAKCDGKLIAKWDDEKQEGWVLKA